MDHIDFIDALNHTSNEAKQELLEYVTSLDDSDESTAKFINTIQKPIEYQKLLQSFAWSAEYFKDLDDILIKLAYQGCDRDIENIRKYVQQKIELIDIPVYNAIYDTNIPYECRANPALEKLIINKAKDKTYLKSITTYNKCWSSEIDDIDDICCINKVNNIEPSENKLTEEPDDETKKHLQKNKGTIMSIYQYMGTGKTIEKTDIYNYDKCLITKKHASHSTVIPKSMKIDSEKIAWNYLSINPDNPDKIEWQNLLSNPREIELLSESTERIDISGPRWVGSQTNPGMVRLVNNDNIPPTLIMTHALTNEISSKLDKLYNNALSHNTYDYYMDKTEHFNASGTIRDWRRIYCHKSNRTGEKLYHFNKANHFPRSRLVI